MSGGFVGGRLKLKRWRDVGVSVMFGSLVPQRR